MITHVQYFPSSELKSVAVDGSIHASLDLDDLPAESSPTKMTMKKEIRISSVDELASLFILVGQDLSIVNTTS